MKSVSKNHAALEKSNPFQLQTSPLASITAQEQLEAYKLIFESISCKASFQNRFAYKSFPFYGKLSIYSL